MRDDVRPFGEDPDIVDDIMYGAIVLVGALCLAFLGWVAHDAWGEDAQLRAEAAVVDTTRAIPLPGEAMTVGAWASCLRWRSRALPDGTDPAVEPVLSPHQERVRDIIDREAR